MSQLASGEFPGKVATEAPAARPDLAALRAACEVRSEALAGAFDAPDIAADHAAVAAEAPDAVAPPFIPPADMVEALAEAMAAPRPWQRVTDLDKARTYFVAQARRRLAALDPLARGLLVSAEEAEARRWSRCDAAVKR